MYFAKPCKKCLHKSTTKILSLQREGRGFVGGKREDMVGERSILFTRKAGVEFLRDTTNRCETIVENNASQLYPYFMCQAYTVSKQDEEF